MSEVLQFHPLTFVAERDGVTVGRIDTESYAVLPEDGAELLRRLTGGMPVAEATGWYRSTFGEQIDMADFVATLNDLGFLKVEGEQTPVLARVRYQLLGRALFSVAAWICYAAIVAAAFVAMARYPQLRPHPQIIFFTSSLIVVQVVLTLLQMPAVCWHEWFHVMAGRRLGVPTQLGVGRRFYFFVFETNLNGLLGVPRNKRYLPFLAGLLADVLLFSGLTLAAAADPQDHSWPPRLALAIAYTVLIRLIWQALVFMRTDLYYVLTTAVGCTNLAEASSAYLRDRSGRLRSLLGVIRPGSAAANAAAATGAGDEEWSPRDREVAPWFALLSIIGGTGILVALGFTLIPVLITFADRLVSGFAHGTLGNASFWDATAAAALLVAQVIVLPLLAGRRSRRSAVPSAESSAEPSAESSATKEVAV
jgi:hypothetical protein